MARWITLALLLASCGAQSETDAAPPPPPADAGTDAGDPPLVPDLVCPGGSA